MIAYLEMEQTGFPELSTVGVSLRVIVASDVADTEEAKSSTRASAKTLRDSLATQFFSGLSHVDRIHWHIEGGSCTTEVI